jgi:hypothetical protein
MNKICSTCKIEKDASFFGKDKNRPDGLNPLCKDCKRIGGKEYQKRIKVRAKNIPETKTCACCKIEKNASLFSRDASRKNGLNPYCKECLSLKGKESYKKNKDGVLKKQKEYVEKVKNTIKNIPIEKFCPDCKKTKKSEFFCKDSTSLDGLNRICKDCANIHGRALWAKYPEKYLQKGREKWAKNPEAAREATRKSYKKYRLKNLAALKNRKMLRAKRTPPWAKEMMNDYMALMFKFRDALTHRTGIKHSIEHIIPLRGKLVSGLNVPWNISLDPLLKNISKNNKFEPTVENFPLKIGV